jgi:hypothetical protein
MDGLMQTDPSETLKPWLTLWFQPRRTFLYLSGHYNEKWNLVWAALFGFGRALDQAASSSQGDVLPAELIFMIALISGPLGGIAVLYVVSVYFRWISGWFGGKASHEAVRSVFAWSLLPSAVTLACTVPFLIYFGQNWFINPQPISTPLAWSLIMLLSGIGAIMTLWTLILIVIGLAEVNQFSIWKSLLSLLSGTAIIAVPIISLLLLTVYR